MINRDLMNRKKDTSHDTFIRDLYGLDDSVADERITGVTSDKNTDCRQTIDFVSAGLNRLNVIFEIGASFEDDVDQRRDELTHNYPGSYYNTADR